MAASSRGPVEDGSTQRWVDIGMFFRTWTRLSAGSFRAQPPPWTSVVRRGAAGFSAFDMGPPLAGLMAYFGGGVERRREA
jgi:hypothetical protein